MRNEEHYEVLSYRESLADIPGYTISGDGDDSSPGRGNKNAAVLFRWVENRSAFFRGSGRAEPDVFTEKKYREDIVAISREMGRNNLGTVLASPYIPLPSTQTRSVRGSWREAHVYGFCIVVKNFDLVEEHLAAFSEPFRTAVAGVAKQGR